MLILFRNLYKQDLYASIQLQRLYHACIVHAFGDIADALGRAHRGAAVFMNDQSHLKL